MVDFASPLRAPDEKRAFWRVCLFVDLFLEGMFFITARIADPWLNPAPILSRMLHSKRPKYQWATGHFIDHISPHSWGSCCVWEEYSALRALPPSGGGRNGIVSNKWFGEHWHWLYESHPRATMQLQLISFVLIILHCMDYTGCQPHSSSRHRQHKRE